MVDSVTPRIWRILRALRGPELYDHEGKVSMHRILLARCVGAMLIVTAFYVMRGPAQASEMNAVLDFWQPVILALVAAAGGPAVLSALSGAATAAAGKVRGLAGAVTEALSKPPPAVVQGQESAPLVNDDPVDGKGKVS